MGYNELDELGDKIQDIIDSAINEKNYQKLSQSINQTLNKAIDSGSEALKSALNHTAGDGKYTNYRTGSSYDYRQNRSWDFQKTGNGQSKHTDTGRQQNKPQETNMALYLPSSGIKVKGILKTVFGGILTGTFGIAAITVGALGLGFGVNGMVGGSVALAVFAAASGILLGQGYTSLTGLSRRDKYIKALGSHTYCNFQQLALVVGKPVKFVKKDIRRMISRGWFLQGHVDGQETCLITSNETYDQYVSTQKQLEERKRQETELLREEQAREKIRQEAEERDKKNARISPEVQQVLDKGNDFLDKIRRSNDAIPGEEISSKISRMELIIAKIFERTKAHPEIIPDLNRLMDYYLPMTVKLLNAYEEMDSQPVQGENITSSKREIEETIDTLNIAFEKLLDSVFEDTAMDVSSDISVLNTVLAQEGLTEDELTRMRREAQK
nr:5-bromo-4-chloroindolyl phosphate hydrolysis family protein [uncultured Blautia sp.]